MENLFDNKPQVKKKPLPILPDNPEQNGEEEAVSLGRFPSWLHRKLPEGPLLWETRGILRSHALPTVCEEARCPNLLECYSQKTATFLTMGKQCTRNCGFCDVSFAAHPQELDEKEPQLVADSVKELGLRHVVLTMVARDDLQDGGAAHLVKIIEAVRRENEGATIEVLTSDFSGNSEAWKTILHAKPEIFNHNIETVRSLSPRVRHKATYDRTLSLLQFVKTHSEGIYVKSGIMVGLGETEEEVFETLRDLRDAGCDIVTIGQYLQASRQKLRVKAFVHPEQFEKYAEYGRSIGLKEVYAGPFVRSSYNAAGLFKTIGIHV